MQEIEDECGTKQTDRTGVKRGNGTVIVINVHVRLLTGSYCDVTYVYGWYDVLYIPGIRKKRFTQVTSSATFKELVESLR